jgi:hypothetical protein
VTCENERTTISLEHKELIGVPYLDPVVAQRDRVRGMVLGGDDRAKLCGGGASGRTSSWLGADGFITGYLQRRRGRRRPAPLHAMSAVVLAAKAA